MKNKILSWFKNPIVVFGLICLIMTIWTLFETHFHIPDFYLNKGLANKIAQSYGLGITAEGVDNSVRHLLNPQHDFQNRLLYYWCWSLMFFVFLLLFNVKIFSRFRELNFFNNKLFAFLWINISFIIFGIFYVSEYMADLHKYVYNWSWDSWSIPFFTEIIMQALIALIYYPFLNFLFYMTFNLKTKNKFYIALWVAVFIYWFLMSCGCSVLKFTYLHVYLDFHFILWFVFIIYSIGHIKHQAMVK